MPQNLASLRIAYYISDYGYGHATRSIAMIRKLLQQSSEEAISIIVCCDKALPFIRSSLQEFHDRQVQYRRVGMDIGYVLSAGTLEPDLVSLYKQNRDYWDVAPRMIETEQAFMRHESVQLVLSDISPIPFLAAANLAIPSIGISNFTWYTAYERMMDDAMREPWRHAYKHMDAFIALPGSVEPNWGKTVNLTADFYCRQPVQSEVDRLLEQYHSDRSKLVIYFALGMSISVADLEEMAFWNDADCLFIVSSNMEIEHPNIVRIPTGYTESQNYVAISDLVITKPGWGTVAEAVSLAIPMLLVDRTAFAEEVHLIQALAMRRHPFQLMKWEQLKNYRISKASIEAMSAVSDRCHQPCDNEQFDKITEF